MKMGSRSLKLHTPFDWPNTKIGNFRRLLGICMVLSAAVIFFCYTQYSIDELELPLNYSIENSVKQYLIHTSKCRIPNDDPFNEDVKKFFHKEIYLPCSKKQLLTYIEKSDAGVTLHINESLLSSYSVFKIFCCYSSVSRIVTPNKSDNEVRVQFYLLMTVECNYFEKSIVITEPIIMVKCKSSLNVEVYANVHAVVSLDHVPKEKRTPNPGLEKPTSVVLVGIDSISKMNLVRTMPQTYRFLEEHDFINLRGYTKVADNTFPNLMAILTGRTWRQVYSYCNPEKQRMNDCDMIIWNRFNALGYISAYAEDESNIGTFNYDRLGFAKPPTDFYFRPYMIAAEKLPSMKRFGMHTCAGPETSGERIMNLAKDFIINLKDNPKFGLFWMNTFSHDNLNLPSSMDAKVEKFLKDVYPYLENSILVVFSDHGFRFGDIRYTHTGWLEERLPFIYVHLPQAFKERHVEEFNNFMLNTKRLTNPYDLYMTLQDVLRFANSSYSIEPSLACPKCHSLFKEVDEGRTCQDGGIEQHWCMCTGHSYVSPNRRIVRDSAEFVVTKINQLIKSSKNGYKCAYYTLRKIVSSGMSERYSNERNQSVNYFLLMLETKPTAMFEATVEVAEYSSKRFDFRLLGDISRTNRYGDNSKCIDDSLKKYCYCDGLLTSIKSAICNFFNCV